MYERRTTTAPECRNDDGTLRKIVATTMKLNPTSPELSKSSGPVSSTRANATRRLLKRPCAESLSRHDVNEHRLTGDSMKRNATVSPLLSLPFEIQNRIYNFVLGDHRLWIGYTPHEHKVKTTKGHCERIHVPGGLYHSTGLRLDQNLHIGLICVCRQTYWEAALLPYILNTTFFEKYWLRRKFEKETRPAQQRAAGEYEYMDYTSFLEMMRSHSRAQLADTASTGDGRSGTYTLP